MNTGKFGGGLPRSFYLIAISGFLWEMGIFMTQPILTLHYLNLGASILFIGLILGAQSFMLILLRVPITLLAKRVGEVRMLTVSFIAQSLQLLLIGLATDTNWLYYIPIFQILATGSFFQIITSINSNMAPSERQGDALGRHMTIISSGMFVGPALCSVLVAPLGYSRLFLIASLFPILGLILLIKSTRGVDFGGMNIQNFEVPTFESLRLLFSQKNILILAFIRTLYSTSNTIFLTLFSIYLVKFLGFEPTLAAVLFSILGITNTVIKIPSGAMSDRFGRKTVLFITFLMIAIVYLIFAYLTTFTLIAASILVFGACWGIRAVTEWAFLTSIVKPELKTLAIGYMESFWDVGGSLGNFLAGMLAGVLPYQLIFLLLALINLPTLPAILKLKEANKN